MLNYRKVLLEKYITTAYGHNHESAGKAFVKDDFLSYMTYFKYNYLKLLPEDKGAVILELGPGMGQFMNFVKLNGYKNISGLDGSIEVVNHCRNQDLDVALCSDFIGYFNQSNPEARYDMIVANDFLEHFCKEELFSLLSGLRSYLKPGGALIMKIPNASACFVGAHSRYCDFTHEVSFTELSIRQLLSALDFSSIRILAPNMFCFYRNPLNYLGKLLAYILTKLQILIYRLHGSFDVKIVSGSMIVTAKKNT
ncbi:MAG: methyltransferase domain-containing protein [Patescibacteria group bacterium]|nr:methyltransferase domain-containing protein [Patescibacteria group bacterium]